jgi:DNA-binding transcriptional regulator YiaG
MDHEALHQPPRSIGHNVPTLPSSHYNYAEQGRGYEYLQMVNLNTVLNERIARIARKEIKAKTGTTRKAAVRYRSDIATLKRQVTQLVKTVAFLEAQEKKRVAEQPLPKPAQDIRFRADGLRTHRAKLGLSAKDYGQLIGVSGLTVYSWESGKRRPRKAQVAKLAAVRGIGKREALKRLELLGVSLAREETEGDDKR